MKDTVDENEYLREDGSVDYRKLFMGDGVDVPECIKELVESKEAEYYNSKFENVDTYNKQNDKKNLEKFAMDARAGKYTTYVEPGEIKKKVKNGERPIGDIFTYIFYYPLNSIVGILKSIMGILKVISIPAFFGGCFCLYMYFSKNPEEWYYQLWFGVFLIVAPFVASAIYFVLEQVQLKLLERLAKNKHVMTHLNMS